jgi:hypothetical protein
MTRRMMLSLPTGSWHAAGARFRPSRSTIHSGRAPPINPARNNVDSFNLQGTSRSECSRRAVRRLQREQAISAHVKWTAAMRGSEAFVSHQISLFSYGCG